MQKHSEQFLRKRKLLIAAPLLIAPFLTLLFWSLGGGQGANATPSAERKGLNTEIPNAQIKDNSSAWDKYALYEKAKRDSLRKAEAERTDPYFRLRTITEVNRKDSTGSINPSLGKKDFHESDDEAAINRKLAEINAAITSPVKAQSSHATDPTQMQEGSQSDESIDRLEQMMIMMQGDGQADPEMQGVESVLDKILDVQHPERVRQRIELQSIKQQGKVFTVSKLLLENVVNEFGNHTLQDTAKPSATFIDINKRNENIYNENLIRAIVNKDQVLTAGSVVRVELVDEVYINGNRISPGTFLFGSCSIQNDRLHINIQSILVDQLLIPVSLDVHDFDGLEGIHGPGTTISDATRQSSDQLLQGVQLMSLDPSVGAQAASAGIQTAKTLFSRKNRIVRVHIKSGYQLFLKDTSNNNKSH